MNFERVNILRKIDSFQVIQDLKKITFEKNDQFSSL